MARLSLQDRDHVIEQVRKNAFGERARLLKEQAGVLAEKVYRSLVSAELEAKMRELPKDCFTWNDYLWVSVIMPPDENNFGRQTKRACLRFSDGINRPMKASDRGLYIELDPKEALAQEIVAHCDEHTKLGQDCADLVNNTKVLLRNFTTREKLVAVHPDLAKLLPPINTERKDLPVVIEGAEKTIKGLFDAGVLPVKEVAA